MVSVSKTAGIPAERRAVTESTGMRAVDWAWLLQRITAVIIAAVVVVHLWVQHFSVPAGQAITFQEVVSRLRSPLFVAVDIIFLISGLFHAVNGARAIFLDFGLGSRGEKALNITAIVIGIGLFGFGLLILAPFLLGRWPV